ncbi:PRC-barrel domain-containing protein [Salipaludibacillus daqingensis]|uniref:PRC-barrel domain-containing protein n=1 Tax=Salipaludibacillus daqingensis TaxID=3041001 RepID=UPI002474B749|nr:PRC-barrel domain-containing protein [Salipaludibacillus daqingensis]
MRTFKKVKGAPILNGNNHQLGVITDLTYCLKEGRITGYWVQNRRWWSKEHVLPLSVVASKDKHCFIVTENHPFVAKKHSDSRFLHGKHRLIGRAVNQKDGEMIGIVEDVYFLPDSGKILGYELTEGLFEDLKQGFKVVKTKHFAVEDNQTLLLD